MFQTCAYTIMGHKISVTNCRVYVSKWHKNCRKIAFCLGVGTIQPIFILHSSCITSGKVTLFSPYFNLNKLPWLKIRKSKLPHTIRPTIATVMVGLMVCGTRNITRINRKTNSILSVYDMSARRNNFRFFTPLLSLILNRGYSPEKHSDVKRKL